MSLLGLLNFNWQKSLQNRACRFGLKCPPVKSVLPSVFFCLFVCFTSLICKHGPLVCLFLFIITATPPALKLHQICIRMVRSTKVVCRMQTESNGTPAIDLEHRTNHVRKYLFFGCCYTATHLALQLYQERTQLSCAGCFVLLSWYVRVVGTFVCCLFVCCYKILRAVPIQIQNRNRNRVCTSHTQCVTVVTVTKYHNFQFATSVTRSGFNQFF